jgi:hypothetical protein
MNLDLCRHIKSNGTRCKSPALTERPFCFFHNRLYDRHAGFRHTAATRGYLLPGQHIELTPLEDRDSVQLALSLVINALATGQLEIKRATALLYGLQLASHNAERTRSEPFAHSIVLSTDSLPDGLEVAIPGGTLNVTSPS